MGTMIEQMINSGDKGALGEATFKTWRYHFAAEDKQSDEERDHRPLLDRDRKGRCRHRHRAAGKQRNAASSLTSWQTFYLLAQIETGATPGNSVTVNLVPPCLARRTATSGRPSLQSPASTRIVENLPPDCLSSEELSRALYSDLTDAHVVQVVEDRCLLYVLWGC